jgi:hypothetical protein
LNLQSFLGNITQGGETMEKDVFLIKKAFKHLNDYKRFRAVKESTHSVEEALKMELQQYKAIDQLELTLRGLQNELRKENDENNEN